MKGRNAAWGVLRLAGRGAGALVERVVVARGARAGVVRTRVAGAGAGGGAGMPWMQVLKGRSHRSQ